MIFSLVKKLIFQISEDFNQNTYLKPILSLLLFLATIIGFSITLNQSDLNLSIFTEIQLLSFTLISILGLINLFQESKIWMNVLSDNYLYSHTYLFKLICISYNFRTFSNELIGSIIAKNKLFKTSGFKENITKNIKFGLHQFVATISLSLCFLMLYPDLMQYQLLIITGLLLVVTLIARSFLNLKVLINCLLRSAIYYIQFFAGMIFFYELSLIPVLMSIIALYFILKTIIPIFNFFGGILVRETTLLALFAIVNVPSEGILIVSLLIWCSNFLLPNFMGLYFQISNKNWLQHFQS